MPLYSVVIEGHNFHLDMELEGEDGPQSGEWTWGFYVRHYVHARSMEEAELIAVQEVREREDLAAKVRNPPDDPPVLYLDRIWEVDEIPPGEPRQSGFIFMSPGDEDFEEDGE